MGNVMSGEVLFYKGNAGEALLCNGVDRFSAVWQRSGCVECCVAKPW